MTVQKVRGFAHDKPEGNPRDCPPARLIDPDGEGVYRRVGDKRWGLQEVAYELTGDSREWRSLNYESVWMREDEGGDWHRDRWRWWYGLLPERRCPVVLYAYVTPPADPAPSPQPPTVGGTN